MAADFSWDQSAQDYENVYAWAVDARAAGLRLIRPASAADAVGTKKPGM